MSVLRRIQRNFQITIPPAIRKMLNLKIGDLIEFEVVGDEIKIKPKVVMDKSQSWFWTKDWQEREKEVEKNFREGKIIVSETIEDFIGDIEK
ncbi:MAG: AbrB/MazE/SpoVT family DNA-binding domain-containing protein [Candidatus Humimicrobiia bacterium]